MNYRNDDSSKTRKTKQPKAAGVMPAECPKRAKAVQDILDKLGSSSAVEQPAVGSTPGFPAIAPWCQIHKTHVTVDGKTCVSCGKALPSNEHAGVIS